MFCTLFHRVYPQVWWSALALLHSPHVAVYRGALGLLRCCLEGGQLRLGSAKVQAVLLAAAPGTMGGGAAQLLAGAAAAVAAEGAEDAGKEDSGRSARRRCRF